MMEAVVRNVLRLFANSPVFVVTVVLIMALGIGSCTAIFSLVKEVLLTRLPYRDAGEPAIHKTIHATTTSGYRRRYYEPALCGRKCAIANRRDGRP